jgi:hypothetical protein
MTQTEIDHAALSGTLFDEVLQPLAVAKRNTGVQPYFPAGRDATVTSYFVPSSVTSMTPAQFEFPGGGSADGLIAALVTYWTAEGEPVLAAMGPRLGAIADALSNAGVPDDGSVDIFCYTLF